MWTYTDHENYKTLILGEVRTGKTKLTQDLLKEAETLHRDIAVIDMGPESNQGIGGKLIPADTTAYYTTDIVTPRLTGKTEKETEQLAALNKKRIDNLFNQYTPKPVLFINDVSIYVQCGNIDALVTIMSFSVTCIMNGYFGTSLGEDIFSITERKKMIKLQKYCDKIIWKWFYKNSLSNENKKM